MKKVAKCSKCSICTVELPIGFTSVERFYCTERRIYVEEDDGCTFGAQGSPMTGTSTPEVGIDGNEATGGCYGE